MTKEQKLRDLRNHLQTQACCINIYSIEYKNINKRIALINKKLITL